MRSTMLSIVLASSFSSANSLAAAAAAGEERAQRCFAGSTRSGMSSHPLRFTNPPKHAHLSGSHCGFDDGGTQRCATLKETWNRTFGGFSQAAQNFVFPDAGMSAEALVQGMTAIVEGHASVNAETGRLPGFESFDWGHGAFGDL